MNELANLNQIVSEIKFFENQAVVSYWEIGKRLTQAKKQVPHGEWGQWIDDNLGYSERTAQQLIQVSESFSNTKSISDLSFTKVLALASIKDEEERQEFTESHPVEDMTVRELKAEIKEYKASKERETQELKEEISKKNLELNDIKASNERLANELDKAMEYEPEVIEKEVVIEVEPDDYKMVLLDLDTTYKRLNEAEETLKKLQKDNEDLKNKLLIESNKKKEAINQLVGEQQKEELIREINGFAWTINGFIKDVGGLIYLTEYLNEVPPASRKLFINSAETLEQWANQLIYNINNKES